MMHYSVTDLTTALQRAGVAEGDILYVSTQLFGLGPMDGVNTRKELVEAFYQGIRAAIGPQGTLVVPTFTQQVGRYGLQYTHETTESLTGIFGEYVRSLPSAQRSLHPIFSVAAIGPRAKEIAANISPVAFGRESPFDRLYRLGGKAICAGFAYYSGHITSLMHYVETAFAVPYYYNKYVTAEVWAGGARVTKPFVINVKYLSAGCSFDYRRYIDTLAAAGEIYSVPLGRGVIHSVDIQRQVDVGIELLKSDIYAFLSGPPKFEAGVIPLEGAPDKEKSLQDNPNWAGFLIGV